MFTFGKKKMQPGTLAAVCPQAGGISAARVRRQAELPPVLEFCAYQQTLSGAGKDKSSFERLIRDGQLDRSICVSLVDLDQYSLVMVEAPEVAADELRAAMRWRIKDLIDFNVEEAVIDVFAVPDTKAGRKKNMVYAVVARATEVKKRIDMLLEAGLNLQVVDIPELALRNIAALLPEDLAGVVLVYVGEDQGLITITRQQTLYLSRRLATGLGALPDTLMQSNDPDLIENWLDGIIVEIQRSLDYYESNFSLPPVASLVIAPLAKPVPGIVQYIAEQMDIATRLLDVNSLIDSELKLEDPVQSRCLLAIGAALREDSESHATTG